MDLSAVQVTANLQPAQQALEPEASPPAGEEQGSFLAALDGALNPVSSDAERPRVAQEERCGARSASDGEATEGAQRQAKANREGEEQQSVAASITEEPSGEDVEGNPGESGADSRGPASRVVTDKALPAETSKMDGTWHGKETQVVPDAE